MLRAGRSTRQFSIMDSPRLDDQHAVAPQDAVNRVVYDAPQVYRHYLGDLLQPAEAACLLKYQPHFAGRDVLDIGVGGGRTTRYLAPLARRYEGVDYSAVMVAYMQRTFPGVSVRQVDFRDLRVFQDREFDFVFAPDNVIDALTHEDRCHALREASRVLRPGGMLALSSHNVHFKRALGGPRLEWSRNPFTLLLNIGQCLRRRRNHRRIRRLRTVTPEYALLNDEGHDYALLHYYVARPQMQAQLAGVGLRLLDVFDVHGESIDAARDDSDNPTLLYVAEKHEP